MPVFSAESAPPSPATLRRDLSKLCALNFLVLKGDKKSAVYSLTIDGILNSPIDAKRYCSVDLDLRNGAKHFNFDFLTKINQGFFSPEESRKLTEATRMYILNTGRISAPPVTQSVQDIQRSASEAIRQIPLTQNTSRAKRP